MERTVADRAGQPAAESNKTIHTAIQRVEAQNTARKRQYLGPTHFFRALEQVERELSVPQLLSFLAKHADEDAETDTAK